ncbi:hypothetical protein GZH46_03047, partial [Fragariocoptes setiger]
MIIYKDLITGDEMFTDSTKIKLIDDCLYEVYCKHVTRKQGEIILPGANPSAEGEDEDGGGDAQVESGLDIVLNQQLIETSFNKSDYKNYLKTYTKALQAKWKEMGKSDEELEEHKTKFMEAVKKVLPKLDEASFFMGSSSNPDGMVAVLEYRDLPEGEQPIMLFYKHGLEAEKV